MAEKHALPRPAASFDATYRTHHASVYRWSLRLTSGRRAMAEDITQDVFLKLMGAIDGLDRTEDLGGWLYRVTVNLSLDRLRRERSWVGRFSTLFAAGRPEEAPALDVLFEEREDLLRAMQAMERLPAKERVVLSMRVVDDKPQREIAQILGLSEGYVSKLLDRAKTKVKSEGWEVRDERS
ncbi:MAG: sigma-70 family RNA polymerase sigma factor [Myxococcota bacterium]